MEPPINGSATIDPSGRVVYGKSTGILKYIKFGAGIFIAGFVVFVALFFFVFNRSTIDASKTEFMDLLFVPRQDGSTNLWVVTDPSFKYPIKQQTSSNYSNTTGYECKDCKLETVIYDPATGKEIKRIITGLQGAALHVFLAYGNKKVFQIAPQVYETPARIDVYDAETGELFMDTKAFVANYPELSSGLSEISYNENEKTVVIKTKDGKEKIIFSTAKDKLYSNASDYEADTRTDRAITSLAVLSPETSSQQERLKLIMISGTKERVNMNAFNIQHTSAAELGKHPLDSITAELMPDKIFLGGTIFSQDADCAIVVQKEQADKNSKRLITCFDTKNKKEKWTISQDKIFEILKTKQGSLPNERLFWGDNAKIRHSAQWVTFGMKDQGIIVFDFESGKVLWSEAF